MTLFRKIMRFFRAVVNAFNAFIKPYDREVKLSSSGKPMLEGWSSDDRPYENLMNQSGSGLDQSGISGVLLFLSGRSKGESYFLKSATTYRMGTGCLNDIVITPENESSNEKTLEISVSSSGVKVRAESLDYPCYVNGHPQMDAKLVDQDECQFNGAQFAFVRLI